MCILRYFFIEKDLLRISLLELVDENYLTIIKYNSYTIYNPNKSKIHDFIKHIKNLEIVNDILNIKKETYLTTAIFYNVIFFVCLKTTAMVFTFQLYM